MSSYSKVLNRSTVLKCLRFWFYSLNITITNLDVYPWNFMQRFIIPGKKMMKSKFPYCFIICSWCKKIKFPKVYANSIFHEASSKINLKLFNVSISSWRKLHGWMIKNSIREEVENLICIKKIRECNKQIYSHCILH